MSFPIFGFRIAIPSLNWALSTDLSHYSGLATANLAKGMGGLAPGTDTKTPSQVE